MCTIPAKNVELQQALLSLVVECFIGLHIAGSLVKCHLAGYTSSVILSFPLRMLFAY